MSQQKQQYPKFGFHIKLEERVLDCQMPPACLPPVCGRCLPPVIGRSLPPAAAGKRFPDKGGGLELRFSGRSWGIASELLSAAALAVTLAPDDEGVTMMGQAIQGSTGQQVVIMLPLARLTVGVTTRPGGFQYKVYE